MPVYKAMSSLPRFNQGPPKGLHGFMVGSSKQSQKQFGANKKRMNSGDILEETAFVNTYRFLSFPKYTSTI